MIFSRPFSFGPVRPGSALAVVLVAFAAPKEFLFVTARNLPLDFVRRQI